MFAHLRRRHDLVSQQCSRVAAMLTQTREMAKQSKKKPAVIQLKKAYPGLGEEGEYVQVRPGHARNHLIPLGFARLLDRFERKEWEETQSSTVQKSAVARAEESEHKQKVGMLPQVLERFATWNLVIARQLPNPEEPDLKPTRHVGAADIAEKVRKRMNIHIEPEIIDLPEPITRIGVYDVPIKIDEQYTSTQPKLKVHVINVATPPAQWPSERPAKDKVLDDEEENWSGAEFDDSDEDY